MARKKLIWSDKRSSHGLCNEMEFATFSPPEIPTFIPSYQRNRFCFVSLFAGVYSHYKNKWEKVNRDHVMQRLFLISDGTQGR